MHPNVVARITCFLCLLPLTGNLYGQIEERWILYGVYADDANQKVVARYRIEHGSKPWRMFLAQYGLTPLRFTQVAISPDLDQIQFTWPSRLFSDCRLERVFSGDKTWQSIWEGQCFDKDKRGRPLTLGQKTNPAFGRNLSPGKTDLDILNRASDLLTQQGWHQDDKRICDDTNQPKYSLFCSLFQASREVTGNYLHRRPAVRIVRDLVWENGEDRIQNHTLQDYNNHPETNLSEILTILNQAKQVIRDHMEGE